MNVTTAIRREQDPHERPAVAGELCTCGRPAVVVYLLDNGDELGYCGVADGGGDRVPCVFCGDGPHLSELGEPIKCPSYTVRPDGGAE